MEIILYILGVAGLTWIMVDSEIIRPLRDWIAQPSYPTWLLSAWAFTLGRIIPWGFYVGVNRYVLHTISRMLHCYGCCGFWCGLSCAWLSFTAAPWWHVLLGGFAGSFIGPFSFLLLNYLEVSAIINLPDDKAADEKV